VFEGSGDSEWHGRSASSFTGIKSAWWMKERAFPTFAERGWGCETAYRQSTQALIVNEPENCAPFRTSASDNVTEMWNKFSSHAIVSSGALTSWAASEKPMHEAKLDQKTSENL